MWGVYGMSFEGYRPREGMFNSENLLLYDKLQMSDSI